MKYEETETQFASWVRALAARSGFNKQFHVTDSRRFIPHVGLVGDQSAKGFPDWLMINRKLGVMIVVELKSDKGKIKPEQVEWLEAIADCGIKAFIWRPRDRTKIEKIFKDYRDWMVKAEVV